MPARQLVGGTLVGCLVACAALSAGAPAQATSLSDAKARASALRHQVDALNEQVEIATERYDASYAALGAAVNARISAQTALDAAQEASGTSDDQRARRARALYESGGGAGLYATVLDSGDITQVASRLHSVQIVLNGDNRAVTRANHSVTHLELASSTLTKTAAAATALQKTVSDQADHVRTLLGQTNALLASADSQVRSIEAQQEAAAQAAAAAAAARELAAANANVTGDLPDVPTSPLAAAALAFASAQRGKPYLWGATGPDSYDCSGLTGAAYAAAGLVLPRTSREQWYAGPHIGLGQLQPGDLLFWAHDVTNPATIHHVAIYAGAGMMVAAPHTGTVVQLMPIYLNGYIGAVRPQAAAATSALSGATDLTGSAG